MNRKLFFFLLFGLFFLFVLVQSCSNPTHDLYVEKCAKCHGENGTGKSARIDFTRQNFSAETIRNAIVHGKGEMANIPGIEEPELSQLVEYVLQFYVEK